MNMIEQIICEKRSYSKEFHAHAHHFGQFLFPLQGSLDIETKWQEINLNTDFCLYLPPSVNHQYRSQDRNQFLILDIPLSYLPKNTTSMYIQLDQQWTSIRYLLLEEARSQKDSTSLINLTKYVTNKLQVSKPPSIEYVHQHYKERIRLETLAKIEHYHPVYYSTWFKKQTGKSLMTYITDLRLQEAKDLLRSTGWPISRISEEIGFENASSFTRWFVHSEGITPKTYRKLHNR